MTVTIPLSNLVQRPTEVASLAAEHDVILDRRNADDLYLSTRERHEQEAQGLRITTSALAALARLHPGAAEEVLTEALPWIVWLPAPDKRACIKELLADLRAGAETDQLRPFVLDLAAWRSTAIAWSDPQLLQALRADHDYASDAEGAVQDGEDVMTYEDPGPPSSGLSGSESATPRPCPRLPPAV